LDSWRANTSDIDFVDRNEDLRELLRKVTEPIKGTQYFLPLGRKAWVGRNADGRRSLSLA